MGSTYQAILLTLIIICYTEHHSARTNYLSVMGQYREDANVQPLIAPLVHHRMGEMRCLHLRNADSPFSLRTWTPSPVPALSNWGIPLSSLALSARGLYYAFKHYKANHATPDIPDRVSFSPPSPPRSSQSDFGSSSGTGWGFLSATTVIFICLLTSCYHSSISDSSWLKWAFFLPCQFMIVSIEWHYLIYLIGWSPQCRGSSASSAILIIQL